MDEHPFTNRLVHQKSPYLLQHAHNPVDWYPWGPEAFLAAKNMDRPIFLSIGYATCHWCHVMEQECFESPAIAKLMNDTFVNIKVDREELPDVDALYMEFSQSIMTGSAGWPLNVILTPELEPFFAATYLPPQTQQGLLGIRDVIARIREMWTGEEKEHVVEQAKRIVDLFADNVHLAGDEMPDRHRASSAAELLFKMADPVYGGMKGAPKFPVGYQSDFLLTYAAKHSDTRALFLADKTLDMMHRGGIYDHLGGGFSRYSVDDRWLIPHFEKMLYDNAILAHTYVLAWQATKRPLFADVAREIIDYVLREMTHPEGGVYSAEDADSDGHEGLFYTWTEEEVNALFDPADAKLFCDYFGLTFEGNFEGRNILHTAQEWDDFVDSQELSEDALREKLLQLRQIAWQEREKRTHPLKDDKILSPWNGSFIQALIIAGCAFGEERYVIAAERAARFIKKNLWRDGHLLRRWRDGDASFTGGLDDYAYMIRASLSLFEADLGDEWLVWAREMAQVLKQEFKIEGGAFYQSDGQDNGLILRKVHYSDGAEPSGNAIHAENLLRLAQITRDPDYVHQAEDIFRAVKRYMDNYPPGYAYHLLNLLRYYDHEAPVFVIALNAHDQWYQEIKTLIYQRFIPHRTIIWHHEGHAPALDYLSTMGPIDGQSTLYICKRGVCLSPIHDLNEIKQAISSLK